MRLPLLLLLFAVFFLLPSTETAQRKCLPIPRYTIDLDQPPEERWRKLAVENSDKVKKYIKQGVANYFSPTAQSILSFVGGLLHNSLTEPYRSELAGFARYTNISIGDLFTLQFLYEAIAHCTSIVSVDNKQRIWHARNFDFGVSDEEKQNLKDSSIDLTFTRGGKALFRGLSIAGYIGVHTGLRYHGYSISLNQRNKGSISANLYAALAMYAQTKSLVPVGYRIRSVLESKKDYHLALYALASQPLIAPCYFIVGGLQGDQGAVITRTQTGELDVYHVDLTSGRWFVVETNYDRWEEPPEYDNRRDPAKKLMRRMGHNNVTVVGLFKILSTPPVYARTLTSTVMSANQSLFYSTKWSNMEELDDWEE